MTHDEIRKLNEERKRIAQARSKTSFLKWVNDKDTMVIKLAPPFEGYDRAVKDMNSDKYKLKIHYRMHPLGDFNFLTKKPISNPRIELTIDDVRKFKDEDAKIWTTPANAAKAIQDEVELGHSILQIKRNGKAHDTSTSYTIIYATSIYDSDWDSLLPKMSKEDIAKLQSEEKWNMIDAAELEMLQSIGVKEGE